MNRIKVFIVDDHSLFREGMLRLLSVNTKIRVVGSASCIDEALEAIPKTAVDVLMLDYDLGERNAVTLVRQLRQGRFEGRILLITAGLPPHDALELVRLGISGIVHKQDSPESLLEGIADAAAGKLSIDPRYLQTVLEAAPVRSVPRLTGREREVLQLLLEGCSNKEIAGRLHVSESAVKASIQQLFTKANVRTRSQLVRFALETPGVR